MKTEKLVYQTCYQMCYQTESFRIQKIMGVNACVRVISPTLSKLVSVIFNSLTLRFNLMLQFLSCWQFKAVS